MDSLVTMVTSVLPMTTGPPGPLSDVLWMVILGFLISYILSVAIGANDVANSFGTSVGAKVLTLKQALFLATIFETLGAVLMGSKVAETISSGIFDPAMYEGQEEILVAGEVSALTACAIWLFIATAFKMPVSTTHSIVGASLGFHLVVFGVEGVQWFQLGMIALSWVTSPVLSGLISAIIFAIIRQFIMNKEEPLEPGLRSLPFWYSLVVIINFFSIFYGGPATLGFDKISLWGVFVLSFGSGLLTGLAVWFVLVPHLRKTITASTNKEEESTQKEAEKHSILQKKVVYTPENSNDEVGLIAGAQPVSTEHGAATPDGKEKNPERQGEEESRDKKRKEGADEASREASQEARNTTAQDHPHVRALCSPLQILSATFASFAHGSNDVSNAVGPLITIWLIYQTGQVSQDTSTPLWILFYGACGISLGLWVLGRRVIQTVGEDITLLTPSSGFSVELGAAATVLLASNIGIPISTTHCKVGSVVSVGWVRSRYAVHWRVFGSIALAWLVTLPVTVGLSAGIMAMLRLAV